jgi:hypothetical protein
MKANRANPRRRFALALLAGTALVLSLGLFEAVGQTTTFNEREVKSEKTDKDDEQLDVWSLDFRFKDPRLIKVNIPGRGTRICWYMWYQVINRTKEPRLFIPDFELVTTDYPGVYHDEILPSVQDAIRKLEDPSGYQDIKNSVTIAAQPIPVSRPEGQAFPRVVTGVAIWDGSSADPAQRDRSRRDLADSTRFSIYISGLSNGWVLVDPIVSGKNEAPVVRRKTLKLNFQRLGTRDSLDSREIQFVPPAEWMYRASTIRLSPDLPGAQPKMGPEDKGAPKAGALPPAPVPVKAP